ncbi:MAG: mechanosensitive ion channel family protein [Myxococcales bacterium]|jgi:small-conductance mechanosensitive channel
MNDLLKALPNDHSSTLTVMLIIAVTLLVSRAVKRLVLRLAATGHLNPLMAARLQVIRRWVFWLVAGLVVLQATGLFDNAWALLSAVLAAVAIGFFAVWSLLANATSALLILAFRPFRHGDAVELVEPTNGTVLGGTVVDINMMYTAVRERDADSGREAVLHIPNSLFFQKLVRTRIVEEAPRTVPFYRESQEPPAPS